MQGCLLVFGPERVITIISDEVNFRKAEQDVSSHTVTVWIIFLILKTVKKG